MGNEQSKYQSLREGDVIREGDQWYNWEWYSDGHTGADKEGPWYNVREGNKFIGEKYGSDWKEMRRPL